MEPKLNLVKDLTQSVFFINCSITTWSPNQQIKIPNTEFLFDHKSVTI